MRVFAAVDVDDPRIRGEVKKVQESLDLPARPARPELLHFTLRFLGEIPESAAVEAAGALSGVRFEGFGVRIRGMGAFPSAARPRVVWAGVQDGRQLRQLASAVSSALGRFAAAPAGRFSPHLTVFRVKSGAGRIGGKLEAYRDHEFGSMDVSCVKLKSSVLGPSGPSYRDIGEARA